MGYAVFELLTERCGHTLCTDVALGLRLSLRWLKRAMGSEEQA